ncbi:hypothetical protein [Ruicaihuangia caeni]|uniref:Uncharacterized protein n=1 Tax=Ruicaihuangia caeni TaxID=3042517 RepID=A0AAW6T9K1_9MICO|nr:hypothetical protein [Klugiella sp. YN-L-19]MDI2098307.1 hypothetical protein [Klugiella sp. YN-L-19]
MCRATKCNTCGKTTWTGCGEHIQDVKRQVPASQWCNGQHSRAEVEAAAQGARGGGFLARLFGR